MGTKVRGHICIRRKAKDGATGPAGAAGKSIRTTVWETGKQYYAGDTQVDGVYPLDIVSDKAMAIGTSGVNFYMCIRSHTSSSSIPLTNTSYWSKLNSLKPVVTYLILAEAIKANLIDVANLAADTTFINNLYVKHLTAADGTFKGEVQIWSGNTLIANIGNATWPLWIGAATAALAPFKVNAAGAMSATAGNFGLLHIDNTGLKIQSDDSEDDYQYGHLKQNELRFYDDDLEAVVVFDIFGLHIYESSDIVAGFNRYSARTQPRRLGSSSNNTFALPSNEEVILTACSGNAAYLTLPTSPVEGQKYRIINKTRVQYITLRSSDEDIVAAESSATSNTSGGYNTMTYSGTPAVVYAIYDGGDWVTHL